MRRLMLGIINTVILLAILIPGVIFYLAGHPEKICIAIDESYNLQPAFTDQIPKLVSKLSSYPFAQYSLITGKRIIHNWQKEANLDTLSGYGPSDIINILDQERFPMIKEATKIYIIINSKDKVNFSGLSKAKMILVESAVP